MARVLVVGAGAVGQVFGWHLQLSGAEVWFLLKPVHVTDPPFTMYPLNLASPTSPRTWRPAGVITAAAEASKHTWDEVWLAVSQPALRGAWLPELLDATGLATVVALVPGHTTTVSIPQRHRFRVVHGLIPFMAYAAPLPGETRFPRPGLAYWMPPTARVPIAGRPERAEPPAERLTAGRLPAAAKLSLGGAASFGPALLNTHIAALELASWSMGELRAGTYLELAASAAAEAVDTIAQNTGERPGIGVKAAQPWVLRLLTQAAPVLIPIELEPYLRAHFTKVGDQTLANLTHYRDDAARLGRPHKALDSLVARLTDAREI